MRKLKEIQPAEALLNPFSPALMRDANMHYLKSATQGWLRPVVFTLTMKQRLPQLGVRLTRDLAKQNLHHFLNVVNYKLFGKTFQRHGKALKAVAVLEWPLDGRCHYHGLIDCPADLDSGILTNVLRESWGKTQWGYNEMDIKPARDKFGWLVYITKQRDLAEDAIDWENALIS